jgi:WD40 repeat protein
MVISDSDLSLGGIINIWNLKTEEKLMFRAHRSQITDIVSYGGNKLVSAGGSTIKIWNSTTGGLIESRDYQSKFTKPACIAASVDGKIISGLCNFEIEIWNPGAEQELVLSGHQKVIACIAVSPDGKKIASGSYDNTIKIWDSETGKETMTLTGYHSRTRCIAFSADGKKIASGSRNNNDNNNTIKVWDSETGEELMTLNAHGAVRYIRVDIDRILAGCADGNIQSLDITTGQELWTLKTLDENEKKFKDVSFIIYNGKIIVRSSFRTIKIYDFNPL